MNTNTIFIHRSDVTHSVQIRFLDILFDETLSVGTIYVPFACQKTIGTLNTRLKAKCNYEYLLRLSSQYEVYLTNSAPKCPDDYFVLVSEPLNINKAGLITDCYILSRYKQIFLEHNLFNSAVSGILSQAQTLNCEKYIVTLLEEMLQNNHTYEYLYQGSQPFLIYTGDDHVCYGILSAFAQSLGTALQQQGYLVEYFNLAEEPFTNASRYIGMHFQAIIGMQSYMFSARLKDKISLLHDHIAGPKYNFVFDHPVWFQNHLLSVPKELCIFTLDQNYVRFIQHYYHINARFLPPAGIEKAFTHTTRSYDVVFIGTYINNSHDIFAQIKALERPMRFLVNRFWLILRKHPSLPAENALKKALEYYQWTTTEQEFLDIFHSFRPFTLYLSYYYRYQIIRTLVTNNIEIHIFGHSWETCPLLNHPKLIWHENDLSTEECLDIWQQSKISLNIMSWHKNAITERILNSMLQKSVVLTEHNPYMESVFSDGTDCILYELDNLDILPSKILSLLDNAARRNDIAQAGYQKALQLHTWNHTAQAVSTYAAEDSYQVLSPSL